MAPYKALCKAACKVLHMTPYRAVEGVYPSIELGPYDDLPTDWGVPCALVYPEAQSLLSPLLFSSSSAFEASICISSEFPAPFFKIFLSSGDRFA